MGYPIFNIYVDREFDSELTESEQKHSSEEMANNPDVDKYHFIIDNNGTVDDLRDSCRRMMDFVLSVKDMVDKSSEESLEKLIENFEE